jgi:hypothetical protein
MQTNQQIAFGFEIWTRLTSKDLVSLPTTILSSISNLHGMSSSHVRVALPTIYFICQERNQISLVLVSNMKAGLTLPVASKLFNWAGAEFARVVGEVTRTACFLEAEVGDSMIWA